MREVALSLLCLTASCRTAGLTEPIDRGQAPDMLDADLQLDLAGVGDLAEPVDPCLPPFRCITFGVGDESEPFPFGYPEASFEHLRADASGSLILDGAPKGRYVLLVTGCTAPGLVLDAWWWQASWDADVPPDTSISLKAQAAALPEASDPRWQDVPATTPVFASPLVLVDNLEPNPSSSDPCATTVPPNGRLRLQIDLTSSDGTLTPRLRSLRIALRCGWCGL